MARRKLLGWICTALLGVAACAVPAYATGTTIMGPSVVEAGEQISIAVTTTSAAFAGEVETDGLQVVSASHDLSSKTEVVLADHFEDGTVTYLCEVTGDPGDTVSFGITGATQSNGGVETEVDVPSWSATVKGGTSDREPIRDKDRENEGEEARATSSAADETPEPDADEDDGPAATVVRSARTGQGDDPEEQGGRPAGAQYSEPIGPSPREPAAIIAQAPAGRPSSGSAATVKPAGGSTAKASASAKATEKKGAEADPDDHLPSSGDATNSLWALITIGCAAAVLAIIAWRKVLSQL